MSVYVNRVENYQLFGYNYIIDKLKTDAKTIITKDGKDKKLPTFENLESFGYNILQKPLEALNIVYPNEAFDKYLEGNDGKIDEKQLVGKAGLDNIMEHEETQNPPSRFNYTYKTKDYGRIFSPSVIGKYSKKISEICNIISNSTGIVLVFSQWIDGGLVPLALALEEMGITRHGTVKSLFKDPPTEPVDAVTFLPKVEHEEKNEKFHKASYIMITGEKTLSPNNVIDYKALTDEKNKNGEYVKVVLISQAGSEGLDFKNIRQVHILDPWYNMNRIEQIVGRAVRTCSHKQLPFVERNVEIYLHGSMLDNNQEAADLYVYRLAEMKALQNWEGKPSIKRKFRRLFIKF